MAVNGIEIAVGQKWRTRGKREVEVIGYDQKMTWTWMLSNGNYCTNTGHVHSPLYESEYDLIELIEDAPAAAPQSTTASITPTLRDEFAKAALAALIGHEGKEAHNRGGKAVPTLAKWAYEYADAMLAARGGDK